MYRTCSEIFLHLFLEEIKIGTPMKKPTIPKFVFFSNYSINKHLDTENMPGKNFIFIWC